MAVSKQGQLLTDALDLMRKRQGQVVPYEMFCGVLWNDDVNQYSLGSLYNAISRLRRKGYHITNIEERGYRLDSREER